MSLVVSLSSIPPRFDKLEPVLNALLAQTAKIDEIRLYLPKTYRRFPDYDGSLPDVPRGVRIMRPNDDLGPASKVLWTVDDIWLSGHMERKGVPIWCLSGFEQPPKIAGTDESGLFDAVIDGAGRAEANLACVRYMQDTYGIWR